MDFKIYVELFNHRTGEDFSILLPEEHLFTLIAGFCLPQELKYHTLTLEMKNTFGFEDTEFVNILYLNKVLLDISHLEDWEQEKIADLFSIRPVKDLNNLIHCYNTFRQYDVISDSIQDVNDILSGLVLLSLFPTSAIEIVDEIPAEEKNRLYLLGEQIGLIQHINNKYYVGDDDVLEQLL